MASAERVAVVTGGGKGVGQGIARALGGQGMTVFISGRDAEALAATAAQIDAAGGRGIPVTCDHRDDAQTKALFDRVAEETGRLDLLVNNAAAVHQDLTPEPFWKKDLRLVDMLTVGLRSDYVATYHAAPLLVRTHGALVVHISFYGAVSYFTGPAYGAAKAGTDKMAYDMAVEFRPDDVAVVSLWPGFVMTDQLKQVPHEHFPDQIRQILPEFETPEFTGLVIAGLLDDPRRMERSGQALVGARVARELGIRDIDGKQPRDWCDTMGVPHVPFSPS